MDKAFLKKMKEYLLEQRKTLLQSSQAKSCLQRFLTVHIKQMALLLPEVRANLSFTVRKSSLTAKNTGVFSVQPALD